MESQVIEEEIIGPWIGRNHICGGQVSMTLDTIDCVSISKKAVNDWIPERRINALRKLEIEGLSSPCPPCQAADFTC